MVALSSRTGFLRGFEVYLLKLRSLLLSTRRLIFEGSGGRGGFELSSFTSKMRFSLLACRISCSTPRMVAKSSLLSFLKMGFLYLSKLLALDVLSSNCCWYLNSCISASILSSFSITSDRLCSLLLKPIRLISCLSSTIFLSIDLILVSISILMSSKRRKNYC